MIHLANKLHHFHFAISQPNQYFIFLYNSLDLKTQQLCCCFFFEVCMQSKLGLHCLGNKWEVSAWCQSVKFNVDLAK